MDIIPLFRYSKGLDNTIDSASDNYSTESGISSLATCVNITHSKTGRPSSRSGYSLVQPGSFHSLFCDGENCYVGRGTDLYRVGSDLSLTGLRAGLSGSRISFCRDKTDTYYANGSQNGVIKNGLSYPWPVQEYEGPKTTRVFSTPPVGTLLALYKGHMLVAVGSTIYVSEPWGFGLFNLANYIHFDSPIRLLKPVEQGVFVSDSECTWFLTGSHYSEFSQSKVASYPALEGSCAIDYEEALAIGLEAPGLCALWASTTGMVIGFPNGQIMNKMESRVSTPDIGSQGAGLLYDHKFIYTNFF